MSAERTPLPGRDESIDYITEPDKALRSLLIGFDEAEYVSNIMSHILLDCTEQRSSLKDADDLLAGDRHVELYGRNHRETRVEHTCWVLIYISCDFVPLV